MASAFHLSAQDIELLTSWQKPVFANDDSELIKVDITVMP
jgi:hypothetical protein